MSQHSISQDFLEKNIDYLDDKKPQTTYKIKYVSQYIKTGYL